MEGGDPPLCGGHPESGPRGRPRRSPTRTRLRNRRFAALRRLIREGRYFSEREMRLRAPRLYQRHIGRFGGGGDPETPPGDPASAPPGPPSLAQLLLKALEQEAPQPTDDESSDDSGDPPAGERPLLRREFLALMYQRFLDGEDPDFDYRWTRTPTWTTWRPRRGRRRSGTSTPRSPAPRPPRTGAPRITPRISDPPWINDPPGLMTPPD
ncbi:coiled-coil domain-containing protein 97 isoform X2 [Patagioenas fasciata]|uniref:coiled-coil domain-containing protein 97 isoform X2 n=1 Tax=Patagioenas fasciata TaxID=372321 RepID=UPI003A996574